MSRRGGGGGRSSGGRSGGGSRGGFGGGGRSRSSSPSRGGFGSRGRSFSSSRSSSRSPSPRGGRSPSRTRSSPRSYSPRYSRPYTGRFYRGRGRPYRVWPHYYRGSGFRGYYRSRYPYFPFILDLYRPWYRPIVVPVIIESPTYVDDETSPEQQIRDELIQGSTVGEVSLAFGDLSKFSESGIQAEVDRINEIIRETDYWTSFQEGGQTFIAISNAVENEEEFLAKMRMTIEGNPRLYLNRHNGDVSNNAFMDFVAENRVPPENILYYSPK